MKKLLAASAVALILIDSASARDMWFVWRAEQNFYFADTDAGGGKDKAPRMWLDTYNFVPKSTVWLTERQLWECDCAERRYRVLTAYSYSPTGQIVTPMDVSPEWVYLPPDSAGLLFVKFACASQKERAKIWRRVISGDEKNWVLAIAGGATAP